MLKKLLEPEVTDICPNCGQACTSSDVLCPNCGKNLDELFEQLPDSDIPPLPRTKFLQSLLVILIGILIGVASAIIAVYVLFTYGSLSDKGSFVQWRSLGSPPENITKIVGICDNTVCVQTNNNKIYGVSTHSCDVFSQSCWKELEQPLIEEAHFRECWFRFAEKNAPKRVRQMMRTNNCGSAGAIQTNYALLEDGNIWIWEHTVSDLQGLQWFVLALPVAVISFIIGVVLVLICAPILWRKWETATS